MNTTTPPVKGQPLPTSIRVVSYNCWGLKYLATYRHERLTKIGAQLAKADPPPEIVGLQECWTQQDYNEIRARTQHILPYGKFYYSGFFGGGLAILSKWPIEESSMRRYPLNGRPAAFYRGDWYVGKGVACARIRIGPARKDVVEVFCTHLHAPYEREPNDSYICHRTAQAWEIAKMMRHAAERGHLVLGLGDFNMIPLSLAHRLIETHSPVKDVWRIVHPDSAIGSAENENEKARGRPIPSAEHCLLEHGTTCDSKFNTWRWSKAAQKDLRKGIDTHVEPSEPDPKAKRLDYVFFGAEAEDKASQWAVRDVSLGMVARHPELKCSLSDHFSVEATLVRNAEAQKPSPEAAATRDGGAGTEANHAFHAEPKYMDVETYDEILEMIRVYTLREQKQGRLRLCHFGAQIFISIGCLVASWWSPRNFVCFLLMLFSTLGLSAGVLDGLMGGLFTRSELRALREFEWEIRNAKALKLGRKT